MRLTAAISLVAGVSIIGTGPVHAAEEECTPEAEFTDCSRFTFSGDDQSFVVPDGVTSLDVRMWGAGGGDLVIPPGSDAPSTGASDPFYTDGIGVGAFRGDGGDGEVVIQWVTPPEATIVKDLDNTNPMEGDVISYTLTVENTGTVDFPGMTLSDDLSGVLDDATYNDDVIADIGTATYTEPNIEWEGDLAVGETATITYSLTVTGDGDETLETPWSPTCPGRTALMSPSAMAIPLTAVRTPREWSGRSSLRPARAARQWAACSEVPCSWQARRHWHSRGGAASTPSPKRTSD